MLGIKMDSVKKLAKKVKVFRGDHGPHGRETSKYQHLQSRATGVDQESCRTPPGFFAVYVGEERMRFVVRTGHLSHPLFKMMLDKAQNEFGYEQENGLAVPCTVNAFQEVIDAVECSKGNFDLGRFVEEFVLDQ